MSTKITLLLRIIWLAILAALFFLILEFVHFYFVPLPIRYGISELEIKPGSSLREVADQFADEGILKQERFFVWMALLTRTSHKLKAGEYRVYPGETAAQLLADLINGNVILRDIKILPGWTVDRILEEFHSCAYLKHDLQGLTPQEISNKLGFVYPSMEGLFWPDTYSFAKYTSESEVLRKAHRIMANKLTQAWIRRAEGLPYQSMTEALTVASLVEKETALDKERPIIAGVILLRLKKNMYLQIDPTVIFALGSNYRGALTREHLKINSPYNTYVNKGLPPTPIAVPSFASIEAALHPDQSGVLYFVADGNGRHIFSKTLEEHNLAVQKFRAQQSKETTTQ